MFGRRSKARRFGPWQGKYYENARRPVAGGVVVAWNGKTAVSCPPLDSGLGEYRFADGSWASTVTGKSWSAPGGELITVTGEDADRACTALFGHAKGAFTSVEG